MKIHEYQAKEILRKFGVAVPRGYLAVTPLADGTFEIGGSITGDAPAGWGGDGVQLEIDVDLGYTGAQPGFQAEATVYRADGTIVKGLHPRSRHVPLHPNQGPVHLWLEAASNPDIADGLSFRPTPLGDPATAGDRPL